MVASKVRCGILCLWILVVVQLERATALEYFTDKCGQTIDISTDHSEQLDSQILFIYESNQDCTVTIQTSTLQRVLVTFSWVDIDGSPPFCTDGDYLEIYDGPSNLSANKLDTICGSSTPSPVASTLSSITLRFKTDSYTTDRGFYVILTSFFSTDDPVNGVDLNGVAIVVNGVDLDNDVDLVNDFDLVNDVVGWTHWGIEVIVGVSVGCFVGASLLCVGCGCLCCHLCGKSNPLPSTTKFVVAPGNQQQPAAFSQQPGAPPPAYNQPPMAMQQI